MEPGGQRGSTQGLRRCGPKETERLIEALLRKGRRDEAHEIIQRRQQHPRPREPALPDVKPEDYLKAVKALKERFNPLLKADIVLRRFMVDLYQLAKQHAISQDLIMVVGSVAEVAAVARAYDPVVDVGRHVNTEADVMWALASIDTTEALDRIVVNVEGKPGFVRLLSGEWKQHCLNEARLKSVTRRFRTMGRRKPLDNNGFLDASAVRQLCQNCTVAAPGISDFANLAILGVLGDHVLAWGDVEKGAVIDGPSAMYYVKITMPPPTNKTFQFSFDNVACILTPWPDVARPWAKRERKWPPAAAVRDILSTELALVPKSSPAPRGAAPDDTEWRWSFSTAEVKLVAVYTEPQQLVYLVFKSIFYKRLKHAKWLDVRTGAPIVKNLTSYVVKTTMFWECEETDQSDWEESKVVLRVASLCVRLREYLEKGHLPHYFIPEMNILDDYSRAHLDCLVEILKPISLEKPTSVKKFFLMPDVAQVYVRLMSRFRRVGPWFSGLINMLYNGFFGNQEGVLRGHLAGMMAFMEQGLKPDD